MEKNKVLITGGCGFIGSQVVSMLANSSYKLFILDDLSTGKKENIPLDRADLIVCDIRSEEAYEYIKVLQPNYVIHLAAQIDVQTSIHEQQHDADINIMGTLNVIQACKSLPNFKKFVFASTAAVYGNNTDLPLTERSATLPTSPYGQSKLVGEQYLALVHELYQLPYAALRFANVYGEKKYAAKDVITSFWRKLIEEESPVIFGTGDQTRDFIYVEDIASALIEAMTIFQSGIYNISTNEQTSINHVLAIMNELLGKNVPVKRLPKRPGDIQDSCLSNEKFVKHTNWLPEQTIQTGLAKTIVGKNNQLKVGVK
ncbi:NAD-dependent epimerase/dehydratase family protein [Listeria seeligeri]|uniref:NAD-dependent epimerase/dehydratase family protein n=1 Tax=Listeria seeligeri TaxID=1640 RepID=UPI001628DC52|nr:NAD-dependent epimerase/dehydratase family protein [Listeria seeligeri]MBC1826625.1 NAD-dependent epimerase/dehydratase family protein [Listeria seeligeri]MBC1870029.1 NAD-dependent epimerase/dehydratase family protein [Listeria seeligeri]